MRRLAAPFVVPPPTGVRIRTRLRLSAWDEAVVCEVGAYLGHLAGQDLRRRCQIGPGPDQRTIRKQAMTAACSSRWAGAITRTSNDQWERAYKNLLDARAGLRQAARKLRARLAVPTGERRGRTHGYASRAERFQKQRRLQHVQAKLVAVEARISTGRVSVCRGGRGRAKLRHTLDRDDATLTVAEWRAWWEAERLFLTADGETDKPWGNETIRVHPDERWLELRLPTPLAHLSNTPARAPTYRLSCPVVFNHRADEWAAQAPAAPSGTTSRWIRSRARSAGTPLQAGGSLRGRHRRSHNSASIRALGSTSTPTTSPPGPSTPPAARSARRSPSPWTWTGSRPAPVMAGCGRRSPSWFGSPPPTAAAR